MGTSSRCTIYSPCLGLKLPCGHCYSHCKCPPHAHDRYIIALGEVRVAAAQAAASAGHRPFKK